MADLVVGKAVERYDEQEAAGEAMKQGIARLFSLGDDDEPEPFNPFGNAGPFGDVEH